MLRRVVNRLRFPFRQGRLARELREEMDLHRALLEADAANESVDASTARDVRRRFGNVTRALEDSRDVWVFGFFDHALRDLTVAGRVLRTGMSWVSIGMLALAIALPTVMFSVFDALVLRPVPFEDPGRLAYLNLREGESDVWPTWSVAQAWRASGIFDGVGAVMWGQVLIETDAGPLSRPTAYVTPGTLDLLGVPPLRGRLFGDDDAADGRAVIIAETVWRRGFDADPGILGRSVRIDDTPSIVVGVLPASFRFPDQATEVWRPLASGGRGPGAWDRPLTVVRFRKDARFDESLLLAAGIAHEREPSTVGRSVTRAPLGRAERDVFRRVLSPMAAGAALVFLSLCLNVSGLLLARMNVRRRQLALCTALGASRGRLIRQSLAESALLSILGGGLGLVLMWQLLGVAAALLPAVFLEQSLRPLQVDSSTLMVAVSVAVVATVLTGLLPAMLATRTDIGSSIRLIERGGSEAKSARRIAQGFVVMQVALACALLVPMALLSRSVVNLMTIDRGIDPRGKSFLIVDFDGPAALDADRRRPVIADVSRILHGMPGVEDVAWSVGVPTISSAMHEGDWLTDTPGATPLRLYARGISIDPDFLRLYGIPLVSGRTFEPGDDASAVVIEERLATALWPNENAVGHSFTAGKGRLQVIGVARNVHRRMIPRGLDIPLIYSRFDLSSYASVTIKCSHECPPEGTLRQALLPSHTTLRVSLSRRLEDAFNEDMAVPRLMARTAVLFAAVAVVTAAGGLFSVLSYAVGRRRHEFRIRSAFGGSSRTIAGLVLRDSAAIAGLGLAIGALTAWWISRWLVESQFGVTIADSVSWMTVLAVLATTTLAASWWPMRAAVRVDVAALLREE